MEMPKTTKDKTNKDFILDVLREAFVTKQDANILFERMRDEVLEALSEGRSVNLFDLVVIEPLEKESYVMHGGLYGHKKIPKRTILKSRIYPRLKKEWELIR
jgi:hypothetical protein